MSYRVVFERDGDGWVARVPEIPGCITGAPTLDDARRYVREAIAVSLDVPLEEATALELSEEVTA